MSNVCLTRPLCKKVLSAVRKYYIDLLRCIMSTICIYWILHLYYGVFIAVSTGLGTGMPHLTPPLPTITVRCLVGELLSIQIKKPLRDSHRWIQLECVITTTPFTITPEYNYHYYYYSMKHLRWRRYKVVNFRRFRSGQLFWQPNYMVCDAYIIYYVILYQMWYYVCITWYYYQLYYDCIMSPVLCCILFRRSLPVSVLASRTSTSARVSLPIGHRHICMRFSRVSLSHMAPAYSHLTFNKASP